MTTYTDGPAPSVSSGPPEPGDDARPTDDVHEAETGMPRQSLGVEDSGPAWVHAEIQRRMREAAGGSGGRHARRERAEAEEEQAEAQQADDAHRPAARRAEAGRSEERPGGPRETPSVVPVEAGERQWPLASRQEGPLASRQETPRRPRTFTTPDPYRSDGGVTYSTEGLRPPPAPVEDAPATPPRMSPARHAESPPAGSRPVTPVRMPTVDTVRAPAPVATPPVSPPTPSPPTPPRPVPPPVPEAAAFVAQRGDDITAEHPRVDERTAPGPRYTEDAPDYDDEYDGGFVATEDEDDDSQVLWSADAGPAADIDEATAGPGTPADDDPYADYLTVADGVSAVEQTMPYPATGQIDHASGRVRVVLSERRQNQRSVRTVQDVQDLTSVGDLLRSNLIGNQLGLALRVAAVAVLTLGSLPALFALFPEIGQVDILGLRLPWLLLGVLVYPFLLLLGWWHTRSAEKVEQEFADHVQD